LIACAEVVAGGVHALCLHLGVAILLQGSSYLVIALSLFDQLAAVMSPVEQSLFQLGQVA